MTTLRDMTIEEFCDKHEACQEGREWALTNCKTMQEVWHTVSEHSWLMWLAIQTGAITDKDLRRFAVFCCRDVWHLLTDERSRNAVEVAERYIVNPRNNNTELARACLSAESVLSGLPVGKHRAAANAAVAVTYSPRYAVAHTEFLTTQAAAADGPRGVENIVRGDMARKRKADWLRANVTPDFTEKRRSG
jgi:Fe-S cluster biosynthesis and repair protein YggX